MEQLESEVEDLQARKLQLARQLNLANSALQTSESQLQKVRQLAATFQAEKLMIIDNLSSNTRKQRYRSED